MPTDSSIRPSASSPALIDLGTPLSVGGLVLRNRLALAPMAGLTDVPFRSQVWQHGAPYMVSEMLGSKPQLWDTGKSRLRRVAVAGVDVNAVQIAGFDPQTMADAARSHVDAGADVVDLNFGCPAKKVCRKAAGSALLADPDLLGHLVEAVANAVPVPVTVKTRLGLEPGDSRGLQAARNAEQAGAQMLVLHARSRACRFVGAVNYAGVRQITRSINIPVLVNGDITDADSARRALTASQADGVMIGRAAIGRPWLFAEILGQPMPELSQQWQIRLDQVAHAHEFSGEESGVRIIRKHIQAYLAHFGLATHSPGFMQEHTAPGQLDFLTGLWERLADRRSAA